jgi:Rps23 Pro-64 3,4-dihydroxylase Tpa1-like proline 4-hydroxylase
MLDLTNRLAERTHPFELFIAQGLLERAQASELTATAPIGSTELIAVDDPEHEKQYRMNLVSLVEAELDTKHVATLKEPWARLLRQLRGAEFTSWLEEGTGCKLAGLQRSIGLYVHRNGDFLSVHKDKLTKAITVILYLNTDWPQEAGGRFQCFASGVSGGAPVCEFAPVAGQLFAFRPTDRSWHAVSEIAHPDGTERLTVQIEYWLTTELIGSAYKPANA